MHVQRLDFAADDARAGFRLQCFEVHNWGTFDRHVWRIEPSGDNALLTGDIGSGKSTLVDALTTLLVPHHRIVYNKAAGADTKERTLYSYLRGEYKSEKDDLTQVAKAVALRDENSYTVLLAYFYNEGFDQGVSLAQVFWLKDQKRNPERFFVVAEQALTIAEHFSGFGSDILDLKRRLRRAPHTAVLDNFKEYGGRFRHLFGIQHEQALELFYQTVSMKSVGNLTDFVRQHMLERSDVDSRIDELRRNFDNLNRAHEAVLKAKRQIEQLTPLEEDGQRHRDLSAAIETLTQCRTALEPYFAQHKVALLQRRIQQLDLDIQKISHRLEQLKDALARLRVEEGTLRTSIDEHGGGRIQQLEQEIQTLAGERDRKQTKHSEYRQYASQLELPPAEDEDTFYRNRKTAETRLQALGQDIAQHKQMEIDKAVDLRELKEQHQGLQAELRSLRRRKTNIPLKNLEIRRQMAETLGLPEGELPFVGELLQVDEAQSEWEGAIERLLHNFALSLLVPEALYAQVSHYVDRTHLRGRLVYYRIRVLAKQRVKQDLDPQSLARKLRIKPDSGFYAWLENELAARFDYVCCETLDEFRRLPKAITRNGQIKSGRQRHEKDDRRSIHDRSHYVLGWSNESKIKALENKLRRLEDQGAQLAAGLAELGEQQQRLQGQRDAVRDLLKIADYTDIYWHAPAQRIQRLEEEKREIEQSCDVLRSLRTQLAQVRQGIAEKETQRESLADTRSRFQQQHEDRRRELDQATALVATLAEAARTELFPKLDAFRQQAQRDTVLTLQNLDKCQRELREFIQRRLDGEEHKSKRLTERIIKQMQAYNNEYPAQTTEVDASLAALPDYGAMLKALTSEDLPRHEARFKQLLNEGTINSVALFQNQLDKERQDIEDKIRTINTSLREIEYNPGTYIELVMDKTQDPEIRDFQQDLRQCLAHSLDDSALYNETKFLQVKAIIERFNAREHFVDLDRKWTRKVTDVRNWYYFSASERWLEDGSEKEFYSDSAGKSGGQKEKLAYTILASALAYQFGLEWNAVQSRSFRFVVIDEAFGRGSDESTRYGLELFKKLNLQLLIVTPLQKIHIIEDYIASVHFIHNEGGHNSMIRNLTVEEYRADKQQHLQRVGG